MTETMPLSVDQMEQVLIAHQRKDAGSCLCGWSVWGASHARHVAEILASPPEPGPVKPRCPRCGSERWVSVSLDEGYTRRAQCVPCGAYHKPMIGPGYKSPRFRDPDAVHPDYR